MGKIVKIFGIIVVIEMVFSMTMYLCGFYPHRLGASEVIFRDVIFYVILNTFIALVWLFIRLLTGSQQMRNYTLVGILTFGLIGLWGVFITNCIARHAIYGEYSDEHREVWRMELCMFIPFLEYQYREKGMESGNDGLWIWKIYREDVICTK